MKFFYKFFAWSFLFFLMSFLALSQALAEDYDIYVDIDHEGDQKGDEDDPYKTIAKAIEEADDEDEIYIEKGEYDEDLVVDKEIYFFGDDLKEVIIDGQIEIRKNVEIEKLTIEGNVIVKSEADVIFDNIVINHASEIAINAEEGSGEIVVKNSTIKHSGTKGFYIQRGRDVIISGCDIYDNEEEGVDLRINVDGTISGNNIYNNGESGLEFIVADSDLNIKNNSFKGNGSSGVAAQYYNESDEKGKITIANNTISDNGKYGLDCNNPQGGSESDNYWKDSIKVDKNKFNINDDGDINKKCEIEQPTQKMLEEQQEKQRQEEIEKQKEKQKAQEEIVKQNRQITIQENEYKLDKLVASKNKIKKEVEAEKKKIEDRNFFVTFLFGPDYKSINNIKKIAPDFTDHLTDLDNLDRELIESSNHKKARGAMDDIVNYVEEVNGIIADKTGKFSLFGWFFNIINN